VASKARRVGIAGQAKFSAGVTFAPRLIGPARIAQSLY
jgi:hypothetical protein